MNGQNAKQQTSCAVGYYSTAGGSAVAIRFEPVPAQVQAPTRARIEIAGPDEDPNLAPAAYASPPCFMHELDPAYLGYMRREELQGLLLRLQDGWKSGVTVAAGGMDDGAAAAALKAICREDIAIRETLRRHIERLGGPAASACPAPDRTIGPAALLRLRGALVAEIRAALPQIGDDAVRRDLAGIVALHERRADAL